MLGMLIPYAEELQPEQRSTSATELSQLGKEEGMLEESSGLCVASGARLPEFKILALSKAG